VRLGGAALALPGSALQLRPGLLGQLEIVTFQLLQLLFRHFLEIQDRIPGAVHCTDKLVQFDLHCGAIAILGVLDQEDHQEGDDGGAGIDDELPGITEVKNRTGRRPDEDDRRGNRKRARMPRRSGGPFGQAGKRSRDAHSS